MYLSVRRADTNSSFYASKSSGDKINAWSFVASKLHYLLLFTQKKVTLLYIAHLSNGGTIHNEITRFAENLRQYFAPNLRFFIINVEYNPYSTLIVDCDMF